jgi:hypothetical protein
MYLFIYVISYVIRDQMPIRLPRLHVRYVKKDPDSEGLPLLYSSLN